VTEAAAKIGLVLEGEARDPLIKTLSSAGYDVHIATDLSRVRSLLQSGMMDAWIFDADSDRVFDLLFASGRFLLPVENPPNPTDALEFSNWAQGLLQHLDAALADVAVQVADNKWSEVRGVWLLAGSAGATSAIQQFFNAFSVPPPVAFIYAQHYDPKKQHQLDSFTVQNAQFSLLVGEGVHTLTPARVIMIPPACKVTVGSFGQISSTRSGWGGHYTPDINELLVILTAANLPSPGVIIFSGMGDDGAGALRVFDAAGGRIWAQDPATAVCHAMPQAAINTGLVHRSGDPAELARALEQLYR
jgi:chemosensory pili system protein ChpB (putative protein-glutamate methylesterase)